jgi:hypothetical protein
MLFSFEVLDYDMNDWFYRVSEFITVQMLKFVNVFLISIGG